MVIAVTVAVFEWRAPTYGANVFHSRLEKQARSAGLQRSSVQLKITRNEKWRRSTDFSALTRLCGRRTGANVPVCDRARRGFNEIRRAIVAWQPACGLRDGGRRLGPHCFGTSGMLQTDALSAILFIVVALFVLHKINVTRTSRVAEGNSRVR
jgi:hypothetical protein